MIYPSGRNQLARLLPGLVACASLMATRASAWTASQLHDLMGPGINYGQHFEAKGTMWDIYRPVVSQATFQNLYNAGFRHVRIPVQWGHRTVWPTSNYGTVTINNECLSRVKASVDNALNAGLIVVINSHPEDWFQNYWTKQNNAIIRRGDASGSNYYVTTYGNRGLSALEVYEDIYKDIINNFDEDPRYDNLIFEGLNEPRLGSNSTIGNFTNAQINTLNNLTFDILQDNPNGNRGGASRRIYMMTVNDANNAQSFKHLTAPTRNGWSAQDVRDRLMITIHYYYTYAFTHVDTDGGWIDLDWGTTTDKNDLYTRFNLIKSEATNFTAGSGSGLVGVEVNIGEFGVQHYGSRNKANIIDWYNTARWAAKTRDFTTTVWDDHGNFRVYNKDSGNFTHAYPYDYRNAIDETVTQ